MTKPIEPAGDGTRIIDKYEDENIYIIPTDQSFDIEMVGIGMDFKQKDRMLTGLGIISTLITMLIEDDRDREEISGRIWESSRRKGDLADVLSMALIRKMK